MQTPVPFALRAPTPASTPRPRRVLLIESDVGFGRRACAGLSEVGLGVRWATTRIEAFGLLNDLRPDVALLDLELPDGNGLELIGELAAARAGMPIVVLTAIADESKVLAALRAGASGYVFKSDLSLKDPQNVGELRTELLFSLVEEALRGGAPMSRAVAGLVVRTFRGNEVRRSSVPELTPRERTVMGMLAQGKSYADVGTTLGVSENTVRSHVRSIYEKLGVTSKTGAVMAALRLGLVRLDSQ